MPFTSEVMPCIGCGCRRSVVAFVILEITTLEPLTRNDMTSKEVVGSAVGSGLNTAGLGSTQGPTIAPNRFDTEDAIIPTTVLADCRRVVAAPLRKTGQSGH